MIRPVNPPTIAPPFSRYSHGMLIEPGARILCLSGQLGIDAQGRVLLGFRNQMEQAMANVLAVLEEVGMGPADLVKLTVLSTACDDATVAAYREVRDRVLGEHRPAALFASVTGFTHPNLLVEIEGIAAAE